MARDPAPKLFADEVIALAVAISGIETDARRVLLERLLNLLVERQPGTARIVASALLAAGDDFGRRLGGLTLTLLSSTPHADFLKEEARIVDGLPPSPADIRLPIDVLVVAIKEVELTASLRAFGVPAGSRPERLPGNVEVFFCSSGDMKIGISWVGTDGNVESAIKMAALFGALRFRLAVLVGMAAGVPPKVVRGDVVVSEEVWAADFEVIRPNGAIPRPKTYSVSAGVCSGLTAMRNIDPGWPSRINQEVRAWSAQDPELCPLPPDLPVDWRPKFKIGVVFAGSRLIEDGSLPSRKESQHERLLAAEMEGAGFAAACAEKRDSSDWLVLRGIADEGQEPRPKDWQFVGAYAAAALLRDGLALDRFHLRPVPPPGLAWPQ